MTNIMKYLSLLLLAYLLTGCNSKQYYKPDSVDGSFTKHSKSLSSTIVDFNKSGATLANMQFITPNGIVENKVGNDFTFINQVKNITLSADNNSNIAIDNKIIKLDNNIISASIDNNLLAIIYIDNSIAVYDLNRSKTIFKEQFSQALANDTKTTNPKFMSDIILFPTLDGKVIIYSINDNSIIRDVIVDASKKAFKNITFFEEVDEQLIAATANSVLSIGANLYSLNLEIKDIATKNNQIYIATVDGRILVMDNKLKPYNEQKFKFSKIFGLAFGENSLYALEQNGYIIKMSNDLKDVSVYSFDYNNEDKFISLGNRFYFGNKYLELE